MKICEDSLWVRYLVGAALCGRLIREPSEGLPYR
jgi:hypothetical protein